MREVAPEPIFYTQTGRAECAKVRTWLVEHGIPFTERNAGSDLEAAISAAVSGMIAEPLLVIGDKTALGF